MGCRLAKYLLADFFTSQAGPHEEKTYARKREPWNMIVSAALLEVEEQKKAAEPKIVPSSSAEPARAKPALEPSSLAMIPGTTDEEKKEQAKQWLKVGPFIFISWE